MTPLLIIKYPLAIALAIFYLIYTIRYSGELRKNILFSKPVKIFHFIMIWIFPFALIFLLSVLTKPAPGSYEVEEKREPEPFSSPYNNGE
jgi:hypothetical protein